MVNNYIGEEVEKILGSEFLTWLWFRSEENPTFSHEKGDFLLYTERRVVVQHGEGQDAQMASASGPASELKEARLGLAQGKKVTRATFRIEREYEFWTFSLKASDFSVHSLRTPKLDISDLNEGNGDAFFLEKMYLIELLLEFLDEIYSAFLEKRLSSLWQEEVARVTKWIEKNLV
ncbi:MAG: hypothetical protein ACRCV3_02390 [Desulfovibrionaceae bacterium]